MVYSSQKEYQHEMETAPQFDSLPVVSSTIIISTPKVGADVTVYLQSSLSVSVVMVYVCDVTVAFNSIAQLLTANKV